MQIGASDIHFESYEDDIDVRVRVDGILHHLNTALSRENIAPLVSRLKILAGLDIAERRVAQDGRVNAVLEEGAKKRNIDFRVSIVPGPFGEDAVLRILDSAKPLLGLDDLGFAREELARLESLITNPEGMLLVTGPTGSGKTTTLYAAINQINTINNKILTVEDPIEYLFPKVNQKQVSDQMGFAAYARSFMRQNPDIILIGEIRDEETAQAALRAAQTGHLVLSTLHTGDAVRTVSRLRTLGLDSTSLQARSSGRSRSACSAASARPAGARRRRASPSVAGSASGRMSRVSSRRAAAPSAAATATRGGSASTNSSSSTRSWPNSSPRRPRRTGSASVLSRRGCAASSTMPSTRRGPDRQRSPRSCGWCRTGSSPPTAAKRAANVLDLEQFEANNPDKYGKTLLEGEGFSAKGHSRITDDDPRDFRRGHHEKIRRQRHGSVASGA